QCPLPPGIANGQHSGHPEDTYLPGSAVQYTCGKGYSLIGNASISCTADGTWSRPQPRCEAIGCEKPEIENGRTSGLETTYRPMDTIVFECDFGYALKGSHESQCQFGGTWNPPVPICEKMLPCPLPPVIANATHSADLGANFTTGMSVNYSCQPGFSLLGDPSVWCTASGNWSVP
ncbi:Complement receptor type 2, partial [Buceros rhinoceros silvestris]